MKLPQIPCLATACLLVASSLSAAEKADLNRIEPVAADQPIPIADFFRPPLMDTPQTNGAGTHLAALVAGNEDKRRLMVYDLGTKKVELLDPGEDEADIYQFAWLNDRRLVYGVSVKKMFGIGLFGAEAGRLDTTYPLLQYVGSQVVSIPPQDRNRPLIRLAANSAVTGKNAEIATVSTEKIWPKIINLSKLNGARGKDFDEMTRNNQQHIVKRYPILEAPYTGEFLADHAGHPVFGTTAREGVFSLHRLIGDHWEKSPIDLELINLVGAGDEPGQVIVSGPYKEGRPSPLQIMDAATGEAKESLLQDKGYDFSGWLYHDPKDGQIVGAMYQRSGPQTAWFRDDYKAVQKTLDAQFPGLVVRIISNDLEKKLFTLATFSDRQAPVYHWVNFGEHSAGLIKKSAPWLDPERMQPMNVMKYKTREGRTLDAYVTLPKGASKENPPPLIVLPHGGPWARDGWGFNREVQFLASRGYAVLQPNYRGSTGYDWMFPEPDRYAFLKMHDDVTDAARTLIKSGLVDAKRVGIMGASFGAYLALSGAVHEPDMYRCAVVNAGVFDWEAILAEQKYFQYGYPEFDYLVRKLGDPRKEKEKFNAISPIHFVDKMHVPIFVAHGKDDPTAPVGQSRALVSELEKNKIEHETMFVSEEGHGMGRLKNQMELYGRIEAFLEKNLKNAK